jgi:DNA-directed RNA polymerase alpha subunit
MPLHKTMEVAPKIFDPQQTKHHVVRVKTWPTLSFSVEGPRITTQSIETALRALCGVLEKASVVEESDSPPTDEQRALFDHPVSTLGLSTRASNCLINAQIKYLGELVAKSPRDLLRLDSFGQTSLQETGEKLALLGLTLGMKVTGWNRPPEKKMNPLDDSIESCFFSIRAEECLHHAHIHFLGQLVGKTAREIRSIPRLTERNFEEISHHLFRWKLTFGMDVGDWKPPRFPVDASLRYKLNLPVESFVWGLSAQVVLKELGIIFLGQLVSKQSIEIRRVVSVGRKALEEIKEVLTQANLTLGMDVGDWKPPT